jgi:hypothetical protein
MENSPGKRNSFLPEQESNYKPTGYREYPRDKCVFCGGISIATVNNDRPVENGYHESCRDKSAQLEKQSGAIRLIKALGK